MKRSRCISLQVNYGTVTRFVFLFLIDNLHLINALEKRNTLDTSVM